MDEDEEDFRLRPNRSFKAGLLAGLSYVLHTNLHLSQREIARFMEMNPGRINRYVQRIEDDRDDEKVDRILSRIEELIGGLE